MKRKLKTACRILVVSTLVLGGLVTELAAKAAIGGRTPAPGATETVQETYFGEDVLQVGDMNTTEIADAGVAQEMTPEDAGTAQEMTPEDAGVAQEMTPENAPAQVGTVRIFNTKGSRKLLLAWEPVEDAAAYLVMRLNPETQAYEVVGETASDVTKFSDKNLVGGVSYTYQICAQNAEGVLGMASEPVRQMAIDADRKMIALTYDDGPSIYTPIVLDALEKYDAHATFFVVGNRVNAYQEYIRRADALGCEFGNHTYAHTYLTKMKPEQRRSSLEKTNKAVRKLIAKDIRLVRPPGGFVDDSVKKAVDMPLVMWSLDTVDWKTRSTPATIESVKNGAADGAVILMHDIHEPTVNAADEIIDYLTSNGYQLVTISEMAAYRGGMTDGKCYYSFKKTD